MIFIYLFMYLFYFVLLDFHLAQGNNSDTLKLQPFVPVKERRRKEGRKERGKEGRKEGRKEEGSE